MLDSRILWQQKCWQITSYITFGDKNFEPSPKLFSDATSNWWMKLWQIRSESPKLSPAKVFCYTVSKLQLNLVVSVWIVALTVGSVRKLICTEKKKLNPCAHICSHIF